MVNIMPRMVNADKLINKIVFHTNLSSDAKETVEDIINNFDDDCIITHGKWVKVGGFATPGGDPVWKCSKCGLGIHTYGVEHMTYGSDIAEHQWVSCPNCGTVMN